MTYSGLNLTYVQTKGSFVRLF